MKLPEAILLSLAAALLIIGIHQVMTAGIGDAYWILMLSSAVFLAYTYRKKK